MKPVFTIILLCRLIDDKTGSFNIDKELLTKLSKNVPKKPSFLKRDLDARKQSNLFTLRFRLPQNEKLDGTEECTLWTPYNKRHNWGRLYLSQNFICFDSRVSRSITNFRVIMNFLERSSSDINSSKRSKFGIKYICKLIIIVNGIYLGRFAL